LLNGGASFCCDGDEAVVFKVADGDLAGLVARDGAVRDGMGVRVCGVRSGEGLEQQAHVGDGAGHGADGAEEGEGSEAWREMSCGGESASRWLERADAGEVCGLADGSAAVAAEAGGGHTCCYGCRFAAAGAACGVVEIPRIVSAAVEEVLGLVGHEELRAVGGSENDGAGVEKTVDDDGVAAGDGAAVEGAADFAAIAGDGDRGFDGDRKAGERAGLDVCGACTDAVGIEVDKGVELGVEALDLLDVGFGEFEGGDFLLLEKFELLRSGQKRERHGGIEG